MLERVRVRDFEVELVAMVKRLIESASYKGKFSAVSLIPFLFANFGPRNQSELLNCFLQVSYDELPPIRKHVATTLS